MVETPTRWYALAFEVGCAFCSSVIALVDAVCGESSKDADMQWANLIRYMCSHRRKLSACQHDCGASGGEGLSEKCRVHVAILPMPK